ncbi:hypothetical protein ACLOJK_020255 [Asimina triloba]
MLSLLCYFESPRPDASSNTDRLHGRCLPLLQRAAVVDDELLILHGGQHQQPAPPIFHPSRRRPTSMARIHAIRPWPAATPKSRWVETHLAIHTPSAGSKPATHQLRPLAPATIHHEPTPSRSVRRRPSSTPDPAGATTDVSSTTARWGSDHHLPCHLSSSDLAGKITLRRDRLLLKSSSVWQPNNTSGDGVVCLIFFFFFTNRSIER